MDSQPPTSPQALDLAAAKLTDVGRKRPHNEDYVEFYYPPDPQQRAHKGVIYLVADGMGGHQAGEVASQGAAELVIHQYYSDPDADVGASIVRAIRAANKQIHGQAQADPSKSGMGTTLVAAVVLGRKVYVANVGDSRAYLINRSGITQITDDHSWVEEQVRAGLLTAEQARKHPQRNLVTRALGSKPTVEVDLFEGEINAGDTLLLCSDGLTGRVDDQEIAAVVRERPPAEATRHLVNLANDRGGNDNISVLIVRAQEEQLTMPMPAGVQPTRRSRLIPILLGAAVILALILGGLAALKILVLDKADSTPTEPAPIPSSTVTAPEGTTTNEVVVPTDTGTASTIQPETTATTQIETQEPTATLASRPTDTPQPTPTTTSILPTLPSSPQSTSAPPVPAPTLVEPPQGLNVRGQVLFKWQYSRSLRAAEAFQVLIWPDGAQDHQGGAEFTGQTQQQIDLDVLLPTRGGPGVYWWSVVVVNTTTERQISGEAAAWRFNYLGAQEQTNPPPPTEQPAPSIPSIPTGLPTLQPPPSPTTPLE